MEDTNR